MAVTAKKNKARLDFANAIGEVVPEIKKEDIEVSVNEPIKEEIVEPVQEEKEEIITEVVEEKPTEVISVDKETGEVIEEVQDDLDALLSSMSQSSGKQKSVYLEYDNYAYIQNKCKKTNVKFSTVLNILLRKAIQDQK